MLKHLLFLTFPFIIMTTLLGLTGSNIYADTSLPYEFDPYITGQTDVAPVLPGFYWSPIEDATWYRLYLQSDDGTIVYDEWFEALAFCAESYCELLDNYTFIPETGLLNGNYEFWLAAYLEPSGEIVWSGGENYEPTTFEVDVPISGQPENFIAWWNFIAPVIIFDYEMATTLYAQLYVGGNGEQYLEWIDLNNNEACFPLDEIMATCIFYAQQPLPLYWGPGVYKAWIQYWGPGGFSSPDGTNSVASWTEATYEEDSQGLVFPDTPPVAPENLLANTDVPLAIIAWDTSLNAMWYEIRIENDADVLVYSGWHESYELQCMEQCVFSINGLNTLDSPYEISVRAWGPGGFSTGGPNGDGYAVLDYEYMPQ